MSREVRRVLLDFDWPLETKWAGFVNPFYGAKSKCLPCDGTGYAPDAKRFNDEWYGQADFDPATYGATPLTLDNPEVQAFAARNVDHSPAFYHVPSLGRDRAIQREAARLFGHFRGQWCHHLIQADVDALIVEWRIVHFTHRSVPGQGWVPIEPAPIVTADMINTWSLCGIGHDAINQHVCIKARCKREGVPVTCPACDGDGDSWPSRAHKALAEAWQDIPPPVGEAYQMWESTSEGSPISLPFATPEELARWLADNDASACGDETATYEQWLGMIGRGWSPSAINDGSGLRSGVAVIGETEGGTS